MVLGNAVGRLVVGWKGLRLLVASRAGGVGEADIQVPDPCGMTTTTELYRGMTHVARAWMERKGLV